MGDIFGGGQESEQPRPIEAFPGQFDILGSLTKTAQGPAQQFLQSAGTPFGGQLSAPLSGGQQFGFGNLMGALSSPLATQTEPFQQALAATQRDVAGGLQDPFQNEFAQALQRNVKREIAEAKSRLASSTSARDQFTGGVRVQGEEGIEARGIGELTRAMLPFVQQLEQNRQAGIGRLANFGFAQEQAPFARIQQALQFGGQQQAAEQAPLDRLLQEFLRQRNEQGGTVNAALGGSTFIPQFFQPTFGPSATGQTLGALGGLAGSLGKNPDLLSNIGSNLAPLAGLFGGGAAAGGLAAAGGMTEAAMLAGLLSDSRLKENVKPISNAIDKVKQLSGNTYNYTSSNPSNRNGGIMAQDLEKVLPDAVSEINGVKFVRYDAVVGLLVEAVKELNAKIQEN